MAEFRSKLEDLVGGKVKELILSSSAGFKPLDDFFTEESLSHPAKGNLHLLHYLIREYTEEGEEAPKVAWP